MDGEIFCVEYSAHGFGYVLDTEQVCLAEAQRRIDEWKSLADTVGGVARISEQRSG